MPETNLPEGFTYTTSPNDDGTTNNNVSIDASRLPQSVPIIGRLFGYTPHAALKLLHFETNQLAADLHRPPHPDEVAALAQHCFQTVRICSQAKAIGLLGGLARAYSLRDPLRYPHLPLPGLGGHPNDPDAFRLGPWRAALRGNAARMAHRGVITALHTTNWVVGCTWVGLVYAAAAMTNFKANDPRMREYYEAMRERLRRDKSLRLGGDRRPGGLHKSRAEEAQARGAPAASRMPAGQPRGMQTATADDASPTGGVGMTEDQYATYREPFQSEDRPAASRDARSTAAAASPDRRQQQSAPPPQPPAQQDERYLSAPEESVFDDLEGPAPSSQPQERYPARVGASNSWERLRQKDITLERARRKGSEQKPPNEAPFESGGRRYPPQRRQQQEGQGGTRRGGEDYSFSSAEQDRELAKDEAQKEFDARVEREREGGDFDGAVGVVAVRVMMVRR